VAAADITGNSMKNSLLAASLVALAPLAAACGSHDTTYDQGAAADPGFTDPADVARVNIDTNQTVSADPGDGVGLFVEYTMGGEYHVFATCDTNVSHYACTWVVVASIDPSLSMDVMDDGNLEKSDSIVRIDDGAVRLTFIVDDDFDGAAINVPAGERLRLSWLLDGFAYTDHFSWVSEGAIQTGAPSDPLDLEPTSP
jgi:hypothetical protein